MLVYKKWDQCFTTLIMCTIPKNNDFRNEVVVSSAIKILGRGDKKKVMIENFALQNFVLWLVQTKKTTKEG